MTIKELHSNFISELRLLYDAGEATAITSIIFEHFLEMSTSNTIANGTIQLNDSILTTMHDALETLKKQVPVQYIIGNAWFYNINFKVNNAVLIPRPETEELVLEAINFLKVNDEKKVLDIGTGSGCIPISIKKNIPQANVTSVDISKTALEVATKNAKDNNVEINFLELDFLNEKNHEHLASFDLIISNPPYIPANEKNILNKNVTDYEPHLALFVPSNAPLLFYKKILIFAEKHLNENGKILMEMHEDFANETAALFIASKYQVQIKKDMQGKERILAVSHSR